MNFKKNILLRKFYVEKERKEKRECKTSFFSLLMNTKIISTKKEQYLFYDEFISTQANHMIRYTA